MVSRPTIFGTRNYYNCTRYSGYGDTVWLNEEDIRPVNEAEADVAIGWLMACGIKQAMDEEDFVSNLDEDYTGDAYKDKQPDYSLKALTDQRPKAIDLFSGAGGFTVGLAPGFNIVGHVEWDKIALQTYELNAPYFGFGCSELIGRDITKITDEQIIAFRKRHKSISLIVGGPPCQGFSTAGKRDPKDPRNSLFIHFVRFVKLIEPDKFIMENVPGMKSMKTRNGESCLEIILQSFRDIGYTIDWRILNAANYGVPQNRRRIFIYGNKEDKMPTYPLPTHYGEGEG
ncbi:DNA cytosine methyltransferase [bacterium]|nr:DNA cytosine methyltransferase [bacterium]